MSEGMKVWIERVWRKKRSRLYVYAASNKGERQHLVSWTSTEDLSQDIQDALDNSYEITGDGGVLCELKLVQEEV